MYRYADHVTPNVTAAMVNQPASVKSALITSRGVTVLLHALMTTSLMRQRSCVLHVIGSVLLVVVQQRRTAFPADT